MNASDLARLQLAKRAYHAAQPSSAEVQAGVRRARLWLRRPRQRRSWFGKGLALVVLALGSLAYAKPHTLSALIEHGFPALTRGTGNTKLPGKAVGVAPAVARAVPASAPVEAAASPAALTPPERPQPAPAAAPAPGRAVDKPNRTADVTDEAGAASSSASPGPAGVGSNGANSEVNDRIEPDVATTWGHVGQALAQGDQARALSALNALSQSDDQRTRDKADLGRAQLLMSRGDSAQACQIARALGERRAGSHIERQAQTLRNSCSR